MFGSNGMLGSHVIQYLKQTGLVLRGFTRDDMDLSGATHDSISVLLSRLDKGDVVINCAGMIPQRRGSEDVRTFFMVNSVFPVLLSRICVERGARLVHITTDCVFDGKKGGSYNEQDVFTETGVYGVSKSLGEACAKGTTIIRTSIIGEERYGDGVSFLEFVRKNRELSGYTDHIWNGVTCLQLAKIIDKMIREDLFWDGVRHIFSPQTHTKYEMAIMIRDAYGLELSGVVPRETGVAIDKSLSTIYDTCAGFSIPPLSVQLAEQRDFWRSQPLISIVMAYYNRLPQFRATLQTISDSSQASRIEVIVVDDVSDDEHRIPDDLIHAYTFPIRVLRIEKEDTTWRNPVIPYNLGLVMTRGEWIVIQNPEVCHIGDVLARVAQGKSDVYYAFTVFALASAGVNDQLPPFGYKDVIARIVDGRLPGMWYCHTHFRNRAYHFCTAIHSSRLRKVGGFNPVMRDGVEYDDDELLCRIERACSRVEFVIDYEWNCMGIHQWHPSFNYANEDTPARQAQNRSLYHSVLQNPGVVYCDPYEFIPTRYSVRTNRN